MKELKMTRFIYNFEGKNVSRDESHEVLETMNSTLRLKLKRYAIFFKLDENSGIAREIALVNKRNWMLVFI